MLIFVQVVRVLPDGYRLRDVSYAQVDDLINGFKHIQQAEAQKQKRRSMNRY